MAFVPSDYHPYVSGSGAEKLADSQIAPLVAAVRGYRSFHDIAEAKDAVAYATPTGRERVTFSIKTLRKYLGDDGDIMIMPWYSVQSVLDTTAGVAHVQVCQMRPKNPEEDERGKKKKYVFPGSSKQPVSMHPALTQEWSESAPSLIITEGVLKEDSLLTGLLLSVGVTHEELKLPRISTADRDEWRKTTGLAALRTLLDRVPRDQRLAPLSVAGVQGWREGQFSAVQFKDRQVVIAFDGDVTSNPSVYTAFDKLWTIIDKRFGRPRYLDLCSGPAVFDTRSVERFENVGQRGPDGKVEMIGVDDYLAHVGTFKRLLSFITSDMPARPSDRSDGFEVGAVRVAPGGRATQIYRNGAENMFWDDFLNIGARIQQVTIRRQPTAKEVREGVISDRIDQDAESLARMKLQWGSENVHGECEIEVEAGLLAVAPDRWDKKRMNTLPSRLTMLPEWPPRGETGLDWLKAVKTSSSEYEEHRRWDATGWVPGPSEPVFVVGNQVLGATRDDEKYTHADVDDTVIPSADRFGVHDVYWETVDPDQIEEVTPEGLSEYKKIVRADIEEVCKYFLDHDVFGDFRHYGAVVLAAALRSTIPDRPRSTVFFAGPPAVGKSYLAAMVMGAWQRESGTWSASSLPGSASDTKAAIERLVSSCGTAWVIDDLAPSASASQATQAQQTVEDIVRAAFNGSSRSKSSMGGDGGLAKQTPPRAQVIITAENALSTSSARGRTIQIDLAKGLVSHQRSNELIDQVINKLALSRVCAAMIRFWHQPQPKFGADSTQATSWRERVSEIDTAREGMKQMYSDVIDATTSGADSSGDKDRQLTMICDLMLSFRYMQKLYQWAGGEDLALSLSLGAPVSIDDYRKLESLVQQGAIPYAVCLDMYAMATNALVRGKASSIGRVLIDCISDAVSAGKAHLQNASVAGHPPFPDTSEFLELNRACGWDKKRDVWEGRGEPIGIAGTLRDGTQVASLHAVNSFQLAAKTYPARIPYGQKPEANWQAASAEKLADTGPDGKGARKSILGSDTKVSRLRGMIVNLSTLISDDE